MCTVSALQHRLHVRLGAMPLKILVQVEKRRRRRRLVAVHLRPHQDHERAGAEGHFVDFAAFERLPHFADAQQVARERADPALYLGVIDQRRDRRRHVLGVPERERGPGAANGVVRAAARTASMMRRRNDNGMRMSSVPNQRQRAGGRRQEVDPGIIVVCDLDVGSAERTDQIGDRVRVSDDEHGVASVRRLDLRNERRGVLRRNDLNRIPSFDASGFAVSCVRLNSLVKMALMPASASIVASLAARASPAAESDGSAGAPVMRPSARPRRRQRARRDERRSPSAARRGCRGASRPRGEPTIAA